MFTVILHKLQKSIKKKEKEKHLKPNYLEVVRNNTLDINL